MICNEQLKLIFMGDIMVGRGVENKYCSTPDIILNGINECFNSHDFAIANLESPISNIGGEINESLKGNISFWPVLSNFDALLLANNHIFDYGIEVACDCKKNIVDLSVLSTGIGKSQEEAYQPILFSKGEISVAILNLLSEKLLTKRHLSDNIATLEHWELLKEYIVDLKKKSDYVIIFIHAGVEFVRLPHPSIIKKYRQLVDMGADFVIGNHPHVMQGYETYNEKLIFYSMGDLVFDSLYNLRTKSIALSFSLRKKDYLFDVIPITLIDYCPQVSDLQDRNLQLNRFKKLSSYFHLPDLQYFIVYHLFWVIDKSQYQIFQISSEVKSKGAIEGLRYIQNKIVQIFRLRKRK